MGNNAFTSVICSILLITGRSGVVLSAEDEHILCRPVTDVFQSFVQGKPDKGLISFFRGPRGPVGPHGQTGSVGMTGFPANDRVLELMYSNLQDMYAKMYQLEMQLVNLEGGKAGISSNEAACLKKFNTSINVGTRCYTIIGGDKLSWDFKEAEANCTKLGGYLADLDSREIYDKLYDYVDRSFPNVVKAWTGMRFKEEKLVLTTGEETEFKKWMAYFPKVSKHSYNRYYDSYSYIHFNIDSSSMTKGIENTRIDRTTGYAICHFALAGDLPTIPPTTGNDTDEYYYDSDYYDYYY